MQRPKKGHSRCATIICRYVIIRNACSLPIGKFGSSISYMQPPDLSDAAIIVVRAGPQGP